MRKHRISDADASALVTGRSHESRPELERLATSLAEFRAASFETLPRPSAELAARLDLANATGISALNGAAQAATIETTTAAGTARTSRRGLVVRVLSWFAGLGLAVKILLGTAVVAAAATGVGAAGALPPVVQDVFDEVVSVVVPTDDTDDPGTSETDDESDEVTDDVAGYDPETGNFGSWVSDQAQDKPGTGQEFGEMVSEEAKNKPHGAPNGDDSGEDVGDDSGDDAEDTTDDAVSNGGSQSDGQHGLGGGPKKDSNK